MTHLGRTDGDTLFQDAVDEVAAVRLAFIQVCLFGADWLLQQFRRMGAQGAAGDENRAAVFAFKQDAGGVGFVVCHGDFDAVGIPRLK